MKELSLWLDSYDDIFSDFDSRQFQKRRISEDFLFELKNALTDREDKLEFIHLLLPEKKRDEAAEETIRHNIHNFVKKKYEQASIKCRRKLMRGIILLTGGFTLILINAYIQYKIGVDEFSIIALRVMLEPAGWFMLWSAFEFIIYEFNSLRKEKIFYETLANARVKFSSSE